MGKLTIFLLVIIILGILSLLVFVIYSKLSYYFNKTSYVNKLIENDLDKKHSILIKINNQAKKTLHAKKDYLVDISKLNENELTNQEKDIKLTEYNTTVNNLLSDYTKLANHKEIKKQVSNLHDIDEKLDASKTYFNKYMVKLSESSVKFPANIIAKVAKIKVIPLFETNETIKKISEEL